MPNPIKKFSAFKRAASNVEQSATLNRVGAQGSKSCSAMLSLTKIAVEHEKNLESTDLVANLEEELDETYRSVTQLTNELEQARMRLEKLSLYDDLTGLANRVLFHDRLQQGCELAKREDRILPVLMMDLDRFKDINDTLGHEVGDLVLQEISARLADTLRHSDTVARLGGDEFVALLPSVSKPEDIITVIEKIVEAVERPIKVGSEAVSVGISIGVALYPTDGADGVITLSNADSAMYSAKRDGRSYTVYGSFGSQDHKHRTNLVGQLRTGISRRELFLEYQPKFNLETGIATGVEALVRWQHPEFGMISPAVFIPAAEQTGVIKPLTMYVLEEAIEQAAVWHQANRPMDLSVNVSASTLSDGELPDQLMSLLERNSLPPERLIIEITETAFMKNPEQALNVLERIHQMGISISIDDFGTGYTSLMYLKSMPVDEVKIDMIFVQKMVEKKGDLAIVRSIIDLCKNLEIIVVAEGVENVETMEKLYELRCDLAQGYFFARPMSGNGLIDKMQDLKIDWGSNSHLNVEID